MIAINFLESGSAKEVTNVIPEGSSPVGGNNYITYLDLHSNTYKRVANKNVLTLDECSKVGEFYFEANVLKFAPYTKIKTGRRKVLTFVADNIPDVLGTKHKLQKTVETCETGTLTVYTVL